MGPLADARQQVDLTVLICTFNRCDTLKAALESVAASAVPDSIGWEVLVVDNNSNDRTRAVVEELGGQHPGKFRYCFEPKAGKSYALNAGIAHARGEIIAFLDDDVTVEPTWLHNLTKPLRSGEWVVSGGRTLPVRQVVLPAWLAIRGSHSLGGVLAAVFDFGDESCELKVPPYGANMAVLKRMFEKYGLYRTDLGPSPNSDIPRPNEDTEFGRRLMAGGEKLWYAADAVAYHPIVEERIQKQYFLNWWFDYGRAVARERGFRPAVFGVPRRFFTIPKIVVTLLSVRTLRWLVTIDPAKRFFDKCWVWMTVGAMIEVSRQGRTRAGDSPHQTVRGVDAAPER